MKASSILRQRWVSLLLAALLASAQFAAAMHAFAHDPGAPQAKTCSACVTAAQLGAGAVDTTPEFSAPLVHPRYTHSRQHNVAVAAFPAHRQRGPPISH
jgi:hypothetical protein